jgi:radical SAM superfamily enzyme YgiQ (UPF0313 family)
MAVKRFLLISPTAELWQAQATQRPRGSRFFRYSMLSSLYVAAALPSHIEVRIVDEDVEPIDFDDQADLVGISLMTYNAPRAYQVADRFRARGKPVVLGGYHPTFMPEEAIQHADAVCMGEAETNVPRMIADFEAGRLQRFYNHGLADLSGLPIPDRRLLRSRSYVTPNAVQATRGCPYRCEFCSITAFNQNTIRTRPVADVIAELATLGRDILFMDDNLIGDRAYAKELFAALAPLGKHWFSQCGIGIGYDDELLRLAARSGCRGLFIGFESLSQLTLRSWRKNVNRAKDYLRVVQRLHEAGIAVFAGFVFGGEEDTPGVFAETLAFLHAAKIDALQATRLTPMPGTPLFADMERQGRIFDRDWSHYDFKHVVFEPRRMSPTALDTGTAWVSRQFYARGEVLRRALQAFRYLDGSIVLRGVLPLNIGYRHRFAVNGTLARGREFRVAAN